MNETEHETPEEKERRYMTYYVDYLVKFDTVSQYARYHELTLKTAQHRLAIGQKLFERYHQS